MTHFKERLTANISTSDASHYFNDILRTLPDNAEAAHLKAAVMKTRWPGPKNYGEEGFDGVTLSGVASIDRLYKQMYAETDEMKIGSIYLSLLGVLKDHGKMGLASDILNERIQAAFMLDHPELAVTDNAPKAKPTLILIPNAVVYEHAFAPSYEQRFVQFYEGTNLAEDLKAYKNGPMQEEMQLAYRTGYETPIVYDNAGNQVIHNREAVRVATGERISDVSHNEVGGITSFHIVDEKLLGKLREHFDVQIVDTPQALKAAVAELKNPSPAAPAATAKNKMTI